MENKFLNANGVVHLWNKIIDKFASKEEVAALASSVIEGYYYANKFYSDSDRTDVLSGEEGKIYIDISSGTLFRFDGSTYVQLTASGSSTGGNPGVAGNGILETVLNNDYTLTIKFTDGTSYTTTSIRGLQGEQGIQGERGKSAYDIAVDNGFDGNEADFISSLKGDTGHSGVYVGSGDMPENCNVQIYTDGEITKIPTKTSQLDNDSGFITKADIPTDESYEFIGQTPLTLENGGNIKLVADGEANHSIVSPTVWNFDNAELTLSNVELDTSEGYYKFTVNNEAAKHTYCYAAFIISGLEVGRNYRFVFDTAGRTYDTANRIWTGSLTAYNGTSTAGGVAFAGKVLKNGNFDFTAADTSLYVRYVCAMNTTPYLGWVAHFNKMYLNYADTSEELTEIYSKSGTFTDIETFKSIPSGVIITTDPTASVYRKAPTDKTLMQSDVPADAEVTGKEIAKIKSYLPLFGKTIVNFGDSIFGQAQPPNDVSTFLAEKTGATVYNCGFGGCRMSHHGTAEYNAFSMFNVANAVSSGDFTLQDNAVASTEVTLSDAIKTNFARLKTVDFSKVDIITIAYSTNDWNGSVALDNEENLYDTTTIGGALRTSIELLLTAYPNVRIFVLSTTWRFWHDDDNVYTEDSDTRTNLISLKLADYNAKLKEVAEEYNIPYVDDYNIGINKFNRSQYFSATDGTHHQIEGRKLIASHLAKELN